MTRILAVAIVSTVFFIGLPRFIKYAVSKYELQECLNWEAQEEQVSTGFLAQMGQSPWYSTDYQKEQCSQYGIYFTN